MQNIDERVARRVLEVVDHGLSHGLGKPVLGRMCVEAAVCYALGEPHSDRPSCVGEAVRAFKIRLNDSNWSSSQARAAGMRRIAIAQLGSKDIDQIAFSELLALRTVTVLLPNVLRGVAMVIPSQSHKDALEAAALACEIAEDLSAAYSAARSAANSAARSAAYSAADSAASAANSAASAAYSAANSAASAASAARSAADSAASAARSAADSARDKALSFCAEITVQVLKELECEGTKWLSLTEGE